MPPATPRKLSNANPTRTQFVERASRGCEPCKRRKRACNGQKPCSHCIEASQDCVYSVVSDHPRSVFSTNIARRLSSGSACETCRRRKTKCDGMSPCGFCATNNIECVNNSERRKRAPASSLSTSTTMNEDETIDRIEDRLRRIEKLMTAFTPTTSQDVPRTTAFRKLSSPLLHQKSAIVSPRQQRHSIHTVSSSSRNESAYISPPNSHGSSHQFSDGKIVAPSPPLSPRSSSNVVASSMLNLSLSPSSSSTSSSSYIQQSNDQQNTIQKEWKSTPIPSLMDQLSKCTFVTTAVDYTTVQYPIYPITPPSSSKSPSNQQ